MIFYPPALLALRLVYRIFSKYESLCEGSNAAGVPKGKNLKDKNEKGPIPNEISIRPQINKLTETCYITLTI